MTNTITLSVKEIVYENGNTIIEIVTPKQWAGRMRRKGYRKTIITKRELASLTIKVKTK